MRFSPEVEDALAQRRPVVALESTLITHGLPYPINLDTATRAEEAVRLAGGVPATIAVLDGEVRIGLPLSSLEELATRPDTLKASRRDLGPALAQRRSASTTVAATLFLAHRAGIRFFATGGIGGVHPEVHEHLDISADLIELSRVPVAVVCSGAKSILHLPQTLELLETLGVPVVGCGTAEFPAFFSTSSGQFLEWHAETPAELAAMARHHWLLGGKGLLAVQPPPLDVAIDAKEVSRWLAEAALDATRASLRGKAVTPFLLRRLGELSQGRTVEVNRRLIIANARLAAEMAQAYFAQMA